jgi:hypothetical protein
MSFDLKHRSRHITEGRDLTGAGPCLRQLALDEGFKQTSNWRGQYVD